MNMPAVIPEEHLPESLITLKSVIGLSMTMKMVALFGGARVFIPKRLNPRHRLALRLGPDVAEQLSRHYGGETLTIPRASRVLRQHRNENIIMHYASGVSVRKLSQIYHLTERQIYSILNQSPSPSPNRNKPRNAPGHASVESGGIHRS